jgi:VWFA-related protein
MTSMVRIVRCYHWILRTSRPTLLLALFVAALAPIALCGGSALAQSTPANQEPQKPDDQQSPEAGGPGGDSGSIALPKKKAPAEAPAPAEPKVKNPEGMGTFSLHVDVPVVTVDVNVVLQKSGQFVPNLAQQNFRVYEDGVVQPLIAFQRTQAPITAVLLCEFAANSYYFIYDMRNAAYAFAQQLKPDDYVAVMTYDMHTQILTDFTQDKRLIYQSLNSLMIPGFNETNLFDALYEALDRLSRVEGRKYIVLIASGRDTFSKINLDKILQKIKNTPNVTIFTVGTGQAIRMMAEAHGMGPIAQMDYLQADNQMTTFARMTGGMAFLPRFTGEMPEIFHTINDSIRNQYQLTYKPNNSKQDGTYRKLRVELVDGEGQPLKIQDEKHHLLKYNVFARDGYKAKQKVE